MSDAPQWVYIDNAAALSALCSELRHQTQHQPWLALDTEFMREKTYFPQLCLLQVGTAETVACIDPLILTDLTPLLELIYDSSITKVFHAAHQDLEIFYHLTQAVPAPIFDTQVAAPLLGHPSQAGYAALVQDILGITLNKGHARTDWARRPLSEAQLSYAADDVRYLGQVYVKLREQLEAEKRLSWLKDDFARQADPARYEYAPDLAWKRIRATKRMRGKALAIVQTLAAWREQKARDKNLPRNWLLRDDTLCDLAQLAPQSRKELQQIRGLNEKQLNQIETELLPLISTAITGPVDKSKPPQRPARPTPQQEALIEALMAVVHIQALHNNMHPTTLASRKDVEQWLLNQQADSPLMSGWRRDIIGEALSGLLDGQRSLQVLDHELQLINS
jgi:ribonuclease D